MKKTNKIISILLVLAMLLSMASLSLTASAADELTDSITDVTLKDTDGDNFYEIGTAEQLYAFANLVNAGNTAINAELTDDIVLNENVIAADGSLNGEPSEFKKWTPIGTTEENYAGIFDGARHTISGLFYHGDGEYAGLFGCTKGKYKSKSSGYIKELGLCDSYFLVEGTQSMYRVGGLVGYAYNTSAENCYVIANFDLTSTYFKNPFGPSVYIGGIYGITGYVDAENCYTVINVTLEGESIYKTPVGGFFGNSTNEKIINCHTNYNSWGLCNSGSDLTGSTINVTKENFRSGEITYLLNGSKADNNSVWKQTLGEDEYPSFNGNYVEYDETKGYYNPVHSHSFEYSVNDDTITGICTAQYCSLVSCKGGTLTISAPAELYTDGTSSREAVIDNQLVEATDYTVTYSTADGSAPKTAGTYTASVTAGGATASVEFTLSNYAAKVTDEDGNLIGNYKTPADAVTAAQENENSTLTLLDDITVAKELDIESGKFTLDLNGKNLVSEKGRVIESYAVLTIKDSGEGGTIYGKGGGGYAIINRGTLTFESGTVKGDGGIENRGTLTFNNGTVEAGDYSAISNFNMVYVYDGVFRSTKSSGINNYGTAFVYGGESSGVLNEGTAYISGGKFVRNGYAALNLNSGTVEITGGSFSGTDREDGIFTGVPYGEWTVYYDENATLTLKGGEFPNGFTVYGTSANTALAKGYAFYDANGNKITVAADATKIDGYVQVKDHYIARVTDKDGNEIEGSPFKTLEEAADAVRWDYENATITLLDDITLDSTWSVGGVVTIDLNGKTLNCTSGDTIFVQALKGFAVTVEDSSENKTGVIRSETGSAIDVGVGSKFILNSGTITAENDYAIMAAYRERNHSLLEVNGGTVNGVVLCYADSVVTGGTFNDMFAISYNYKQNKFSGGIFNGGIKITSFDPLNDILADGYHFRNAQGKVVDGSSEIIEEKVTIEKGADFSADAVVTAEDVVYNGAAQEPDVTVTIGGKILTEGKDYTIAFADNINAGTATVTVKAVGQAAGGIVGGGNSNAGNSVESVYTGEITKEFTVLKADSSIDVYPEANELTYNGEAQTLVVIGDTNDGMIVYSLDGEKYSPLPPTGTNAGKYTVYYKVEGNSNHNDTEPETLTVTVKKKEITASATVADKVYDGTTTVDASAIEITFDGIVDGDDVVVDRCVGLFWSANAGNNKTIEIAYYLSGEDVDNYWVYDEYIGIPEAEYYCIETKANILPRDIADAQIVLGDALTYNGAEQTQSISGVTVDGLEVTYTVSGNTATNVGVYELTITGNGNFSGTKTALFEIAPDTSAIDALTVDNVKSSDKEVIEAVAKQIENAVTDLADDEKKAEYKAIADKCNELLAKINATADEIARIDEAVNGYDTETVTSADIPEISKLIDDIKALADGDNITEDEKSALESNNEVIDELVEKLTEVAEEIKKVDEAVKSYDENSVKSTDSENLEQLKEDIQALIDSTNTTENEKTVLEDMIKDIEGLEDKIEEIENQLEEIKGVENNFTPETVTSEDKTAIEEKIAEIESVNPDNLTEEQKAEYDEIKAGFEALLAEIEKAGSEVDAIGAELEMFDEEKATIFWEDEIEALKAKIDELLADENMGEAEKAKLEEYKAQCDNLIEIINTPARYFSTRLFYFVWDSLNWLVNHFVFIFNWIAAMF